MLVLGRVDIRCVRVFQILSFPRWEGNCPQWGGLELESYLGCHAKDSTPTAQHCGALLAHGFWTETYCHCLPLRGRCSVKKLSCWAPSLQNPTSKGMWPWEQKFPGNIYKVVKWEYCHRTIHLFEIFGFVAVWHSYSFHLIRASRSLSWPTADSTKWSNGHGVDFLKSLIVWHGNVLATRPLQKRTLFSNLSSKTLDLYLKNTST